MEMEMFSKDLRNQETKIINNEKERNDNLTDEETESYEKQNFVIYAEKSLVLIKRIRITIKREIIVITQEKLEELLITFVI